jgi:hypothetical protein
VLNRIGTLGPEAGKRSRGELVLQALDHADARDAEAALRHLEARAYRPFNLVIADNRDAYWLRADGVTLRSHALPAGLSILTAHDLNDETDPRIKTYLPRFAAANPPAPEQQDWREWRSLLAERAPDRTTNREAGLTFRLESGFGTSSAAMIALPAMRQAGTKPIFLFAPGPPDQTDFSTILL